MTHPRLNLLGLARSDLETFFADLGERAFRASQVLKWIYHFGVRDFDAMTNLSKPLRERLKQACVIGPPEIVTSQAANDGTHKWLLRVDGGDCVETVYIPEEDRGTLCISSQVGCALNCTFCATAQQGFNRNLSAAEIMGQVWLACQELGHGRGNERVITNVVLMGMGEPLTNFDNVVKAMELMMDDMAMGLSRRRITLSTAGIIPALHRLRERCPVSLAVSLHAPENELRNQLVPLNRKYPIQDLVDACRRYVERSPKSLVTFEYVMLAGVNDSPEHARKLAKLLRNVPAKVNLIPFNTYPGTTYHRSDQPTIDRFRTILMDAGLIAITRKTRGDDIDAACGQLVGRVTDRTRRTLRRQANAALTVSSRA